MQHASTADLLLHYAHLVMGRLHFHALLHCCFEPVLHDRHMVRSSISHDLWSNDLQVFFLLIPPGPPTKPGNVINHCDDIHDCAVSTCARQLPYMVIEKVESDRTPHLTRSYLFRGRSLRSGIRRGQSTRKQINSIACTC